MATEPQEPEVALTGGRITSGVVRVGDTVRRPVGPHSPFVHRLLCHLDDRGFAAAPRFLGIDDRGRETLTFLHGHVPTGFMDRSWSLEQITAAGRLLRALHDATAGSSLAGDQETVCHNDFSPLNVTFVDGKPAAVFDFDLAGPGERMRDVTFAAWLWLLGAPVEDRLPQQLRLLRAFLAAYGLDAGNKRRFAARTVTRVEEVWDFQERAGRAGTLSWLRDDIAWLKDHAALIDRGLAIE